MAAPLEGREVFVENIDPHGEGLSIDNILELFGIIGFVENARLLSGVSHAACARPAVLTYETYSAADEAVTELQELYEFRRGFKVTLWDARAAHWPRGSCEYAKQVRWRDEGALVDLRADLCLLPERLPSLHAMLQLEDDIRFGLFSSMHPGRSWAGHTHSSQDAAFGRIAADMSTYPRAFCNVPPPWRTDYF